MRKFFAFLLIMLLVAPVGLAAEVEAVVDAGEAAVAGTEPVAEPPALPDVTGHWAEPQIRELVGRGIIKGLPDGTFAPDEPVTRAQFVTLLWATRLRAEAPRGPLPAGVAPDHWAAEALRWATGAGLLEETAYPDGFLADEPISRLEVAALFVRLADLPLGAGSLRSFSDLEAGDLAVVEAAVRAGLLNGYPDGRYGPADPATRAQAAVLLLRLLEPTERPLAWRERHEFDGLSLEVVRLNLRRVTPRVVPAKGRVGEVAPLAELAQGAVAAINGSYFNAYGTPAEPYGHLISDGHILSLSGASTRAVMGFLADGSVKVDRFGLILQGKTVGPQPWLDSWYVYHYNRLPTSKTWATMFTSAFGPELGFGGGVSVVVRGGRVVSVSEGNVAIPPDGYVLSFGGSEAYQRSRFVVGNPVSFTLQGLPPGWETVANLIQAGPLLVRAGQVDLSDLDQFGEEKITEQAIARSAVGVDAEGLVLTLVTTPSAKVADLAAAMLTLGAVDAISLDGGASSGLWFEGAYVTEPGRQLSNALIFVEK